MNYNLYQAEDFAADERFVAYFLQTDEEAVAFWSRWISEHPEKLDEVLNAEQLLSSLYLRLDEEQYEQAFAGFESFLEANPSPQSLVVAERRSGSLKSWIGMAAAAVLILVGGLLFYQQRQAEAVLLTRHSGYGQLTMITLADGSRVSLNSNSTLTYPKAFDGEQRELKLTGEAYFEVSKDKLHPFIVHANGLKTTVHGTSFNVEAFDKAPVSVSLVEGRVAVQAFSEGAEWKLKPSQRAVFDPISKKIKVDTFDVAAVCSWKDGLLLFKNASFETIAQKIRNLYGVELVNKTKDQHWNYTGRFRKTDYLSIVQSICFAKRINYTQDNKTITFIQ
ncbi:FecR family protein [Pedobacter sp. GR22-6]|uniref:FecR family protein n=1 Tax=Pedobacter sp. GR22-6 TaxID=3127957 RepID=UPI00307D17AD